VLRLALPLQFLKFVQEGIGDIEPADLIRLRLLDASPSKVPPNRQEFATKVDIAPLEACQFAFPCGWRPGTAESTLGSESGPPRGIGALPGVLTAGYPRERSAPACKACQYGRTDSRQ